MEEQNLKIDFAFIDEFGQESRVIKTFTTAIFLDQTQLEFLVSEFKMFLIASGYLPKMVNMIQIVEE